MLNRFPLIFGIIIVMLINMSVNAQENNVHSFNPLDLVTLKRVGLPSISPDYKYVIYTVAKYNVETNEKEQSIFLSSITDDKITIELTSGKNDSSPFWFDNTTIGFVSNRNGKNQIWYSKIDPNNLQTLDSTQLKILTNFKTDIGNIRYNSKVNRIAFTAPALINGEMVNDDEYVENEGNKFTTGKVYDKLFIRHWDTFVRPKVREQIFVIDIELKADEIVIKNKPVNIMKGKKLECPVAPFGDTSDYSISPDGETFVFSSRVENHSQAWNTNTNIYKLNYPVDGEPSEIENLTGYNFGYDTIPSFSPDGHWITWFEMKEKGFEADKNRLIIYNSNTKKTKEVLPKWDRSISSLSWSDDSKTLYIGAPSNGRRKIYAIKIDEFVLNNETETNENVESNKKNNIIVKEVIGTGGNGSVIVVPKGKINNNEQEILIFLRSTMKKPNEIYMLEMIEWSKLKEEHVDFSNPKEEKSKELESEEKLTQITHINDDYLKNVIVSEPEEFTFKGHNDDIVHGWLLKPTEFDSNKKYPLAFLIHGGPQGAWDDSFGFRWNVQSYTGAGYVVVAINFHGSTGYGEKFQRAVSKNWGDAPYNDLMLGLDYVLEKNNFIDERKVCALGASFGGYMINWINGHTDRFACLVNHDGIFDTINAYFTTEELFFTEYEFGGYPWNSKARKLYDRWNPMEFVQNWKTPVLIIHGGKDYRLVDGEGISTFTALQRLGVKSRLLYFPDENHWVLKQANLIFWYKQILDWLNEFTSEDYVNNGNPMIEESDEENEQQEQDILNTYLDSFMVIQ